jgi:hypothetical protein
MVIYEFRCYWMMQHYSNINGLWIFKLNLSFYIKKSSNQGFGNHETKINKILKNSTNN